jgi:hypothetical protein
MGQREKNTYSYLKVGKGVKRFLRQKSFFWQLKLGRAWTLRHGHLTSHMGIWMMKFLLGRKGDEKFMHLIT